MGQILFVTESVFERLKMGESVEVDKTVKIYNISRPVEFNKTKETLPLNNGLFMAETVSPVVDTIDKENILCLSKPYAPYSYTPVLLKGRPSMLAKPGNYMIEGVWWGSPKVGLTFRENKENMSEWAYRYMLDKISQHQGDEIMRCIDIAMQDQIMYQDMVDEYHL